MPIRAVAERFGVFGPSDLDLLDRVFLATEVPGETHFDREARASRIIFHFTSGVRDEAELRDVIAHPPEQ